MKLAIRDAFRFSSARVATRKVSSGFTLLELLLVLSLLSSLLGGTIGLVAIARKSDQQAKRSGLIRQEIRRFADDVRRDVNAAVDVEVTEDGLILSQDSDDPRVVYRTASDSTVSRLVKSSTEKVKSKDRYAVGNDADIRVELVDEVNANQDRNFIQWTIKESDRPGKPIRIIAVRKEST